MGGLYKESYYNDYAERDALLKVLYSRLSIAKLQRNKHLQSEIEKQIRAV